MADNQRYRVWSVEEYERDGEAKRRWEDVGSSFAHRNGDGLNLSIYPGLVVTGTVVLRVPKAEGEGAGAAVPPSPAPEGATSKPLDVLVVRTFERDGKEEKRFVNAGIAFAHKDGQGYNVQIRSNLGLAGGADVMLLPHKTREERDAAQDSKA